MVANNANFVLLLIKEKLEFKRAKISRSFFGFCFVCFCQRLQGLRFGCAPAISTSTLLLDLKLKMAFHDEKIQTHQKLTKYFTLYRGICKLRDLSL